MFNFDIRREVRYCMKGFFFFLNWEDRGVEVEDMGGIWIVEISCEEFYWSRISG